MPKRKPKTIPFINNKGQLLHLDENLTIPDLVKKYGKIHIALTPKDEPIPDGWFKDATPDA